MANTITTMVENIPGTPDLAALSSMGNRIVVVSKVPGTGKGGGTMVVNGQTGMEVSDILALHDTLPLSTIPFSGPGIYRFEVTDQDSGAKVTWQTRLGGVQVDNPAPAQMRAPVPAPSPVAQAQHVSKTLPLAPSVQHLGNGWYYNPDLNLLTAPDGNLHVWRVGQALPRLSFDTPALPQATPIAALPTLGLTPNPENEQLRQQLTVMQKDLADSRERERESQRSQEMRDLRDSLTKQVSDANARTEAILAKLSERPHENSEVTELKRRLESQEQLAAMRAETKATTDAIMALVRESTANKGVDPVVNMLTSMLTQMQANAGNNFTLLREMANQERNTMEKMMDKHAETMKESGNLDIVNKVMSGMDMIFDRLRKVTELEREIAGSGGSGVDWMSVIKEVGSKAGSAMQMFQAAKAQEARAQTAQAQAQIASAQAQVNHDRVVSETHKARAAIQAASQVAPTTTLAATPEAPVVAPISAPAPEEAAAVAPSSAPAASTSAPASSGKPAKRARVRIEGVPPSLETATLTDLRALFKHETDEVFFGGFAEYVTQLREEVEKPGENDAGTIAGYILQARELIASEAQKGNVPHAAELLVHGQVAYLVERMLPGVAEGLRSEIVKAVRQQLQSELDAERVAAASAPPKGVVA